MADEFRSGGFRLIYRLHGHTQTAEFRRATVLLGRGADCDVVLSALSVSRNHAEIRHDHDGWTIVDRGSRFGTYVNDRKIAVHRMGDGDRIVLGEGTPEILFELLATEAVPQHSVALRESESLGTVRGTIGLEQLETAPGDSQEIAGPDARFLGLFARVGELLLTSESTDAMLQGVLDLAMDSLPAQRGFVCLCDETLETVIPKAVRIPGKPEVPCIEISRSIAREAIRTRQALRVTNAVEDARFAAARSVQALRIREDMCAPLYHAGRVEGLIYVDTCADESGEAFRAWHLEMLAALGVLATMGMSQARLRDDADRERAIRARLSRYSSPRVVQQIVASLDTPDGKLHARQCEVSVLFADLCGFTPLAERQNPAEVVDLLDQVFERLTGAIFQFDGTLDKYLGDGLLAVFGAPLPQPDHAERAVGAALLMQQALHDDSLRDAERRPLQVRIGINTGMAVAGDIGSPVHRQYTVVGDAVNVASRLESSVAGAGQIVIGPATYEFCKHRFRCEPLPEILLKGKQQAVRPYLVVAYAGGAEPRCNLP